MSFHEVNFPDSISYGSQGGPSFRTAITSFPSGAEQRVGLWEGGRNVYNAAYGIKRVSDIAKVQEFFRARRGAVYGFRFKDFLDFHSDPTNPTYVTASGGEGHGPGVKDQEIGVGDGVQKVFQLKKVYGSTGASITRIIRKPIASTVRVWVEDTELTRGSGFTVDAATGLVTLETAAGSDDTVWASFQFDVPCRFGVESGEIMSASIDSFDQASIPDIPIIEILNDEGGYESEYLYGGSRDVELVGNISLSFGTFLHRVDASTTGLNITLPNPVTTPAGRPVFCIVNSGANSVTIKDNSGVDLVDVAAGEAVSLAVIATSSSTRGWISI